MNDRKDRTRDTEFRPERSRHPEDRDAPETPEFRPGRYSDRNRSADGSRHDEPYGTRSVHDDDLAQIGGSIGYGSRGQSGYGEAEPHPPAPDSFRSGSFGHAAHDHGRHRGKGPRNYQRTDTRLTEDICERLTEDHLIDAGDIDIESSEGRVTLRGKLPERWMKHYVEDLVDACPGVREIDNRIAVPRRNAERVAADQGVTASADRSAGGAAAKQVAPVAPPKKGRS